MNTDSQNSLLQRTQSKSDCVFVYIIKTSIQFYYCMSCTMKYTQRMEAKEF